ncbi:uncharacterized protein RAG0_14667 [Rhynchosporium agropyri]|uniref:Uncharacterized protein n=1 Tax=Rhynchosporium agropyri TaxID=914238 RepID=A0A1E1LHW5_9HELO|nr:uncharacterized protein RAG0_14667 [Rhynchosporium agropyri]
MQQKIVLGTSTVTYFKLAAAYDVQPRHHFVIFYTLYPRPGSPEIFLEISDAST